jgi:hypothetical protein
LEMASRNISFSKLIHHVPTIYCQINKHIASCQQFLKSAIKNIFMADLRINNKTTNFVPKNVFSRKI